MLKLNDVQRARILTILHYIVLTLAGLLAAYIAVETFRGIDFMNDSGYMTFQLWVCITFLVIFVVEAILHDHPWRFTSHNFIFLFIAIPYLNIIQATHLHVHPQVLYYLQYVPLLRGVWAIFIVIGYLCATRINSMFFSYLTCIALTLFFASMLVYVRESPSNPQLHTYAQALQFCALNLTTIGTSTPVATPTARVAAVIMASMGMTMFPLFTVYLAAWVRRYLRRMRFQRGIVPEIDPKEENEDKTSTGVSGV